jgi:hypothetical protein
LGLGLGGYGLGLGYGGYGLGLGYGGYSPYAYNPYYSNGWPYYGSYYG